MTIKLLESFNGIPSNAIVTLDAPTEAALLSRLKASSNLAGGFPFLGNEPFDIDPISVKSMAAESLGAKPGADPRTNFDAIQRALACKGFVSLTQPGTYFINATLTIYDNTIFQLANGVTIKAAASGPLLQSNGFATRAQTTPVTLAWSASSVNCTVNWTNHPFVVGDYCYLSGSTGDSAFTGVFPVKTINSANQFVVTLRRIPAATFAGSIVGKKADANIFLSGGNWDYNASGGNNGVDLQAMTILLGIAANVVVENITSIDNLKWGVHFGAVTNYRMSNCNALNTRSDHIKVYGPAFDGVMENSNAYFGSTSDDFISLQTKENNAFASVRWCYGDVIGARINNSVCQNQSLNSGSAIVLYPSGNELMDDIVIDGVYGSGPQSGVVIATTTDTGSPPVVGRIVVKNNSWRVTSDGSGCMLSVDQFATIRNLELDGMTFYPTRANHVAIQIANANVDINYLKLKNFVSDPNTTFNFFGMQVVAGAVRSTVFEGCTFNRGSGLPRWIDVSNAPAATMDTIEIRDCRGGANAVMLVGGGNFVNTPGILFESNNLDTCLSVFNSTANLRIATANNTIRDASNGVLRNNGNNVFDLTRMGGDVLTGSSVWMVSTGGTPSFNVRGVATPQALAYAAAPAPNLALGNVVVLGTLTGAAAMANPTNVPPAGEEVTFQFTQDATGGRAVTWGTNYLFPTAFVSGGAATNGQQTSITFRSNGTKLWAQGTNVWN